MTEGTDPREALLKLLLEERKPGRENRRAPLSFSQRRIWFLRQLLGDRDASYNVPFAMRLRGSLDSEALEFAVNQVVARHDGLRARFELVDGEPVQIIARRIHMTVQSSRPNPRDVPELVRNHASHVFDLTQAPLLKVSVLTLSELDHVLLLNMHHIVADGWSLACFVDELSSFYRSRVLGESEHLPELPIQYDDFAQIQAEQARSGVFEPQLEYWLNQLQNGPEQLNLPCDHTRPTQMSGRGGQVRFVVPGDVLDGLKAIASSSGATLYMVMLSAFYVLLHRVSGDKDINVGSPVAGRTQPNVENLIGCFVNTVVLRGEIKPDAAFRALLEDVKVTALDALDNQDIPFEMLVEHLRPARSPGCTPVFQAMMALQNIPVSEFDMPGLTIEPIAQALSIAKFDLNLNLAERPSGLTAALEYNSDILERSTAERFCTDFNEILAQLCADGPDVPVRSLADSGLNAAAAPDRSNTAVGQLTVSSSQGFLPPEPIDMTLAAPFEQYAHEHPDDIALIAGDRHVSYGALVGRARQIARLLQAQGVSAGDRVGICMPTSVQLVETVYAVAMLGAAYAPIDPDLPRRPVAAMLDQISAAVLVTDTAERASAQVGARACIALSAREDEVQRLSAAPLNCQIKGGTAAYIIHTSGSSGSPKAVQFPADAAIRSMRSLQARHPTMPGDAHLFKTPFTFDVSIWELFWPLYHGASLVICEPGGHRDPAHLSALIAAHSVCVVNFVPSMLEMFLQDLKTGDCPSLRWVLSGGERLSPATRDLCFSKLPGAKLANLYGPTETHCVAGMELMRGPSGDGVPIGKAHSAFRLHVMNDDLEPVAPGETGELFVGGDGGMAHGYVGQSGHTAERFVPDPFGSPGGRLYRTGDLCSMDANGVLSFLGRRDRQLKLAGRRIEPGEIEAAIRRHPDVELCAVDAMGTASSRRLVAFLVPSGGSPVDIDALKSALSELLPPALIPSDFVQLGDLPVTAHGKLDGHALEAEWHKARLKSDQDHAITTGVSGLAAKVQRIFEDVLGVSPINAHKSFFEQGGHSLMAINVIARCRDEFSVALPLHVIYQASTPAALASEIEATHNRQARSLIKLATPENADQAPAVVLVHGSDGTIAPLLHLSQALGESVAVYGLEAPGISENSTLCPSIQVYAEYYAPLLKQLCQTREVAIVGWSFGGNVAVELARLLTREACEIGPVILLDSFVVDSALATREHRSAAVEALRQYDFGNRVHREHGQVSDDGLQRRMRNVLHSNLEAFAHYSPAPCETPIHLFRAAEGWDAAPDAISAAYQRKDRGWVERLANLRITTVAGDHFGLISEDNSRSLACGILKILRCKEARKAKLN